MKRELYRYNYYCPHFEFKFIDGMGYRAKYCNEAKKQIPTMSEFIKGFPEFCPLKIYVKNEI